MNITLVRALIEREVQYQLNVHHAYDAQGEPFKFEVQVGFGAAIEVCIDHDTIERIVLFTHDDDYEKVHV